MYIMDKPKSVKIFDVEKLETPCERLRKTKIYKKSKTNINIDIVKVYEKCKQIVIEAGFEHEIEWQKSIDINQLTETIFIREHAWVTLTTGFKEKIIRNLFQNLSDIFYNWESADIIVKNENICREKALQIFANKNKINAIIQTSNIISKQGFQVIKKLILENPINTLRKFPYIGNITYFHLAKNIGIPLAKPDRHLTRIATSLNFIDVQTFCSYVSRKTGDSIPVVDIVLWRYATITENYETDLVKV